ncbi:MAG TPA: sensor histidine kinase [Ktedonobacterales bacterium]
MKSVAPDGSGGARISASVALGAGFAVAGLAAGGVALLTNERGAGTLGALAAASATALLVGLLAALALLQRLRDLEGALAALSRGETAELGPRGWPLGAIPAHLAAASARMAQVVERERQATVYREELTRQVSEAAAYEERNRLARELHDSVKQQLFSIGISAAAARARADGESGGALGALDDIQAGAQAAQAEMAALLQQLRPAPLENVGLVEALRDQATALGYRAGAEVTVSVGELPPADLLPVRAQEELFRMAQEALANIARHARARHVALRLERRDAAMFLEVRDDGKGFDPEIAVGGMGLSNLRERARALGGIARIRGAPGQGTAVEIEIPLVEPPRALAPEEVARQAALAAATARGDQSRQWAANLLRVSYLILLFGLPFWAVAASLALAGVMLTQAGAASGAVARLAGAESNLAFNQRRADRETLVWLWIGLALCVWYLPVVAPHIWLAGLTSWLAATASVLLLTLAVWTWEGWRRSSARAFALMGVAERLRSVESRWRETLGFWGVISLILVVGLAFGGWSPSLPPRTAVEWSDAASVTLIVLLVVFNGLETWLFWRWRVAAKAERARHESEAAA